MGSQSAEKCQLLDLSVDGVGTLARCALPEPFDSRVVIQNRGLENIVQLDSPLGVQQGLQERVRPIQCAAPGGGDEAHDSIG